MPPPQYQDDNDNGDDDEEFASNISSEFRLNAPQVDRGASEIGLNVQVDPYDDDNSSLSSREANGTLSSSKKPQQQHRDPRKSFQPPALQPQLSFSNRNNTFMLSNGYEVKEEEVDGRDITRTMVIAIMVVSGLLVGGIIAVVSLTVAKTNNESNSATGVAEPTNPPTTAPIAVVDKTPTEEAMSSTSSSDEYDEGDYNNIYVISDTLKDIVERDYLLCGTFGRQPGFSIVTEENEGEGIDTDLCRAIAAAIFGEDGHVQYVTLSYFERFQALNAGVVDLLAQGTTHTMERSIHEPITGAGFAFSTTYIYEGLQFAGQPPYVQCADNFSLEGICQNTVICVLDASTHIAEIMAVYPNATFIAALDSIGIIRNFVDGFCNVVAGEGFGITEQLSRELGYLGEYEFGSKVISKEPLALVTRPEDPVWSDFVNWIVQALIVAEDLDITSETAMAKIGKTRIFGYPFRYMFRDAVALVGNYREVYDRWLKPLLPRPMQDEINVGISPALFAFPYGGGGGATLDQPVNLISAGSKIDQVVSRGELHCGVKPRPLFAEFDSELETWSGFEVDFCRALAAALFNGDIDKVAFSSFEDRVEDGLDLLRSGDIDVLAGVTHTLEADATIYGFTMSQPIYHDGLSFGGHSDLVPCADALETNAIECRSLRICVQAGSHHETRLRELLPDRLIVAVSDSIIDGLMASECNVVAGTAEEISITSAKNAGYTTTTSYTVGMNRFSKLPKVLATVGDDHEWSQFVYWVISSLIYADEKGITVANVGNMTTAEQEQIQTTIPIMPWFGPELKDMFRWAVSSVGSYGDIYHRNLDADIPRAEMNKVNELLRGPQHVPLPGIF